MNSTEYKFNWEETIQFIRTQDKYKNLVKTAYFEEDLVLNIERYQSSPEFIETLQILKSQAPNAKNILDIGCGNGITSICFALNGYQVTAVEPDPSATIGAGAIRALKEHYKLENIEIYECYAEDIPYEEESFDVVYFRQAMHHAYDLNKFVAQSARVLKKGGLLFTSRDHVLFDESEKEAFLAGHPLQEFYGGENAFTEKQYVAAMNNAGLQVEQVIKTFDNVINCSIEKGLKLNKQKKIKSIYLSFKPIVGFLLPQKIKTKMDALLNEELTPAGRMYSFLARKPR